MLKKLIALFVFTVLVILSTLVFAQESSKQDGMKESADQKKADKHTGNAQQARWEGVVVRSSKDNSTLTVRKSGSSQEKTIQYDNSTQWVSQEHGSKKVNNIDASQVKDGDRVIVRGTEDKPGRIQATLISKRLTPLH
jgi:Domain of unknown function (DUF5666)